MRRGAGFMAFSKDEETRQSEMAALKRERDNTEKTREQVARDGGVVAEREREKEERRRKVEEKRRELEAKRKRAAEASGSEGGSKVPRLE